LGIRGSGVGARKASGSHGPSPESPVPSPDSIEAVSLLQNCVVRDGYVHNSAGRKGSAPLTVSAVTQNLYRHHSCQSRTTASRRRSMWWFNQYSLGQHGCGAGGSIFRDASTVAVDHQVGQGGRSSLLPSPTPRSHSPDRPRRGARVSSTQRRRLVTVARSRRRARARRR
jgi:hypothetical protein